MKRFSIIKNLSHPENAQNGFTLAEVMIVVVIIGVVAALVLPSFIQDMSERINSHRQANIAQKITKSMELMIVNGDYQDISTTEQLVNKLSKYLKIAKVCDSDHLTDCWPTTTIKTSKGKTYNVADAKTGGKLHIPTSTNNVGLVLADGSTLIMNYNPSAPAINAERNFTAKRESLPIGDGNTEKFAYTSNATDAIDFVMDVNGATGPNQESDGTNYFDIRSFRIASFSTNYNCKNEDKIEDMCIKDLGTGYLPINNGNYWAGAKKACEDLGMELPDIDLLRYLYDNYKGQGDVPSSGRYWTTTVGLGTNYYMGINMGTKEINTNNHIVTSGNNALCISK